MREGRPDLRLFHQLYWIIVSSELLVMYIVFPGASIIQGAFPSETVPGRVCLLLQTTSSGGGSPFYESESYKLNMFRLFFPLLQIFIIFYFRFKVKSFMKELCPRKQMSCIGVYKRNVISLQTTMHWLMFWTVAMLLEYTLCTLLTVHGDVFSPQTAFWIWNVKCFLLNEGLHFVLPALLEVPDRLERKKMGRNTFYVRKPGILEPRRAEVKRAKTDEEEPSSVLLSARELLHRKVPSKVIKVAEYRGDDLPNFSRHNIEDKSLQSMPRPEIKCERGEPEKLKVSDPEMQILHKFPKGAQNNELEECRKQEPEKLELSIPRSSDDGQQLRRRQPCTVYCRNHNSFARH